MSYYDWNKIVKNYNDNELKRIYREKFKEPQKKVDAVVVELINRGILNSDQKDLLKSSSQIIIFDTEVVSGQTKSNKRLSEFVVYAILAILIIYTVSFFSSLLQFELLNDIKKGTKITFEVVKSNVKREMIIQNIALAAFIITSILFLIWFYRSYENLWKRVKVVEYSTMWSIWAWFVPVISLFRPYNIMDEINKKTDIIIKKRDINKEYSKRSVIGLWWGLFIVEVYVGYTFINLGRGFDYIDGYIIITVGSIITSVIGLVLGIVTIKMIKNFAKKEEILFESERNVNTTQTK